MRRPWKCDHSNKYWVMLSPINVGAPDGYLNLFNKKIKNIIKTYNSRDSLVVTHPTTNRPACGLSTAERTGSPVFHTLWSYVLGQWKEWDICIRFLIEMIAISRIRQGKLERLHWENRYGEAKSTYQIIKSSWMRNLSFSAQTPRTRYSTYIYLLGHWFSIGINVKYT